MRRLHGWAVIIWMLNLPPCAVVFFAWPGTWEKYGTFYLVVVSLLTAALSDAAAWQGAKIEEKQDQQAVESGG